ncbi:MAG: hypothetical protein U9N87_11270, partial [Planctomycetota bacterium]|nr:hypothetical protein [Planctomycetota bacterium]
TTAASRQKNAPSNKPLFNEMVPLSSVMAPDPFATVRKTTLTTHGHKLRFYRHYIIEKPQLLTVQRIRL